VKWIPSLLILVVILGCGSKQVEQLAIETADNARISIAAAENVGARDVAVSEINAAEEMLTNAESSLLSGDVERSYRLALRAYLHARIATEKSLAIRQDAQVKEAQAELELRQQATEEILNNLEKLKAERAAQKK
jgi:hypothetical protein